MNLERDVLPQPIKSALEASGSVCIVLSSDEKIVYVTESLKHQMYQAFVGLEGEEFSRIFVLDGGKSLSSILSDLPTAIEPLSMKGGEPLGNWKLSKLSEPEGFLITPLREAFFAPGGRAGPSGLVEFVTHSSVSFVKMGLDGRLLDANPSGWENLGYTKDEFFSLNGLSDIFSNSHDASLVMRELVERGHINSRILPFTAKDGGTIYGEVSAAFIPEPSSGEPPFVAGYIVVVTDKVTAQKEAQRSHELLDKVINTTPDCVFVKDLNDRYVLANKAYATMMGRSLSEMIGKSSGEIWSTELSKKFRKDDEVVKTEGRILIDEERVSLRDGSRVFHTIKAPLRDEDGTVSGIVGWARNITENYELKEELERSSEQFKVFIEEVPFAVAMFDRDLGYIACSNEWRHMFSAGDSRESGQPIFFDSRPNYRAKFEDHICQCLRGQSLFHDDDVIQSETGENIHFRWHMTPWRREGAIGGFILMMESLEERRKMESELELERAKALQSSKMAAVGEMASSVAHEVNNPLSIIQVSNDLIRQLVLKDKIPVESVLSHVDRIRKTVEKVSGIIRNLKNISRHSYADPKSPVSPKEVLGDALFLFREKFRLRLIDFRVNEESSLLNRTIYCNRVQASQVLINLLSNSMDAVVRKEDRWIEVDFAVEAKFFVFIVRDSGPGVDLAVKDKIFEHFFTTKVFGQGTGLGLSISRDIAQSQSGDLLLTSESNPTEFSFRVPLYDPGVDS